MDIRKTDTAENDNVYHLDRYRQQKAADKVPVRFDDVVIWMSTNRAREYGYDPESA
jgi:hypothetical protein